MLGVSACGAQGATGEGLIKEFSQLSEEYDGNPISLYAYRYPAQGVQEAVIDHNPTYRGFEASMVKVPIAMSVMRQAYEAGEPLDELTQQWISLSVGYSDNDSTMYLYSLLGETVEESDRAINETYDRLGIADTRAEGGWGINETSAKDYATIGRAVHDGLPWVRDVDMDILREAMLANNESQSWGVGAVAGQQHATYVLCKNGWIPDDSNRWHLNTMGVVALEHETYALSAMTSNFEDQERGQQCMTQTIELALRLFSQ